MGSLTHCVGLGWTKHSLGSLPAWVGWNHGDPILLSLSALVEGEVIFLSIPGAWKFSWEVHYPTKNLPRRCSAFRVLLNISWRQTPHLSLPLSFKMGDLDRTGGKEVNSGSEVQERGWLLDRGMTILSLINLPSLGPRSRSPEIRRQFSCDYFLTVGSLSGRDCKTRGGFSNCFELQSESPIDT